VKFWKVAKRGEFRRAWRTAPEILSQLKSNSGRLLASSFRAQAAPVMFARLGRSLVLTTSALFFFSNFAAADSSSSNSIGFSCKDGYTGYLCKAGKDSNVPCTGSDENTVDNLKISGVTAGSLINFSFSSVSGTVSTDVQVKGSGSQTGDPSPASGTVPVGMSYTVTSQDASDSESNFQVILTNNPVGKDVTAAANYTVSCAAPSPSKGTINLKKVTTGPDGVTVGQTTFHLKLGGTAYDVPVSGFGSATVPVSLDAGSYNFAEPGPLPSVPAGLPAGSKWENTGLSCQANSGDGTSVSNGTSVTLGAGGEVTCTATNTLVVPVQKGSITIKKHVSGGTSSEVFGFSSPFGSFGLTSGGASYVKNSLDQGSYTITEDANSAFFDPVVTCQTSGGATTSPASRGVTIVIPQSYTETPSAVCTFDNKKAKDDRAEDVTKLFIHRRVDNLLSNQPDRARILRRLDGAPASAGLKDGGSYSEPFDNASPVPGGLKDPVRSDLSRLQGRTSDAGSSSIGSVKVSMSLSQAAAEAQASEKKKLADAGLSFGDTPYGYSVPVLQPRFDMWMEAHVSKYTESLGGINREGDFNILYVGGDYVIRPGLLIGALAQIDRTVEDIKNPDLLGRISGAGWMAGPYAGAKLSDHLYFDARAAWGRSSNSLWLQDSIVGYRTGAFNTDRWLATTGLTGNYQFGLFRVSPQIELAYGSESADAYKTSLNQSVDKVSATIGRMSFGPEFGYTNRLDNGVTVEPQFSVKGVWNFDDAPIALSTGTVRAAPLRAEVETGIMIKMPSGFSVRASGSYDGIGDKNLEVWTTKGWINFPLN
jgi:outer membrane autotransporter protein